MNVCKWTIERFFLTLCVAVLVAVAPLKAAEPLAVISLKPTDDLQADVEYLLFPRLFAMAEVGWSPRRLRQDEDFLRRVPVGLARLEHAGVRSYRGSEYHPNAK